MLNSERIKNNLVVQEHHCCGHRTLPVNARTVSQLPQQTRETCIRKQHSSSEKSELLNHKQRPFQNKKNTPTQSLTPRTKAQFRQKLAALAQNRRKMFSKCYQSRREERSRQVCSKLDASGNGTRAKLHALVAMAEKLKSVEKKLRRLEKVRLLNLY